MTPEQRDDYNELMEKIKEKYDPLPLLSIVPRLLDTWHTTPIVGIYQVLWGRFYVVYDIREQTLKLCDVAYGPCWSQKELPEETIKLNEEQIEYMSKRIASSCGMYHADYFDYTIFGVMQDYFEERLRKAYPWTRHWFFRLTEEGEILEVEEIDHLAKPRAVNWHTVYDYGKGFAFLYVSCIKTKEKAIAAARDIILKAKKELYEKKII